MEWAFAFNIQKEIGGQEDIINIMNSKNIITDVLVGNQDSCLTWHEPCVREDPRWSCCEGLSCEKIDNSTNTDFWCSDPQNICRTLHQTCVIDDPSQTCCKGLRCSNKKHQCYASRSPPRRRQWRPVSREG